MSNTAATEVALQHDEAVALLHAWADALARAEGIRALSIKGIAATEAGLRPPRTSSDADVLVEPASYECYCQALTELGWEPYVETLTGPALNIERVGQTFKRSDWPVTIDVHGSFPGLLTDADSAFDALWQRRTEHRIAGVPVVTCDLLGHAIILAAHAARTPIHEGHGHENVQLEAALDDRLDFEARAQLALLAETTGTVDTLADTWRRMGVHPRGTTDPAALHEWRERAALSASHEALWVAELRNARLRDWPRVLARALWLSDGELITYRGAAPTSLGLLRARAARLWAGLLGLPHALRVHRRAKRIASRDQ